MSEYDEEDEYDEDDDTPEMEIVLIIAASEETMREPTMLDLAKLISLQGSMFFAHTMAMILEMDIMVPDESKAAANAAAEETTDAVQEWWEALIKPDILRGGMDGLL